MRRYSMGQKLMLTGVGFLAVLLAVWFFFPKEPKKDEKAPLRLGSGEDVTGVLSDEICRQARLHGYPEFVEGSYSFVDCCAGTAQWALQTKDIDLGFYCIQAAHSMTQNSEEFWSISGIEFLHLP
ncbi:MAG: hypothetical protein K1W34_09945 [Lachnospiraceae bacterium]